MKIADKILSDLPLFRHFTAGEISALSAGGAVSRVKKGSSVDLKKLNTFNVVINGLFEIEALGKTDIVYLAPGSFFGHIPFTGISLKGRVRAMLDTTMIIFKPDDIYRFFIANYGAMRGYINTISRMGLELSSTARLYADNRAKIISVTSTEPGSGVTTAAAVISSSLSRRGRTAVIDLAYSGSSVFDSFDKKITAPFSHRRDDEPVNEEFIAGRTVSVHEKLDIMNMAFSSRVKVDPGLLSPLIFVLSKRYDYIVFDAPSSDADLLRGVLELSDYIVNVEKSGKAGSASSADGGVTGIKTLLRLVNSFYTKTMRQSGGYILDEISVPSGTDISSSVCETLEPMIDHIARKKKALAVESNYLNSIFLSGFFSALSSAGDPFDIIHTSSMSYIPAALYTVSADSSAFKDAVSHVYGESGFEKSLSIDFPENHIFRAAPLMKFCKSLFGENRSESYKTILTALLMDESSGVPFISCSGRMRDTAAASLALSPLFESVQVNGINCTSGYPDMTARPEHLFRTDAEVICYLTVENSLEINPGSRVPALLKRYLSGIESSRAFDKFSDLSDASLNMEVAEKNLKTEKIIDSTMEKSVRFLKDNRLFT